MTPGDLITRTVLVEGSSTKRRCLISLIVGLIAGFTVTQIFNIATTLRPERVKMLFSDQGRGRPIISRNYEDTINVADPEKHTHSLENSSMAQKLYREVRVFCWVMTGPKNHQRRAVHVKRTWGKRCNKLLFMSSVEDKELGAIGLNVSEGRDWLWAKTREAYKYIYENHFDEADWFYKADDDTYAILENMRYMLYPYSPDTPIYFGSKQRMYVNQNIIQFQDVSFLEIEFMVFGRKIGIYYINYFRQIGTIYLKVDGEHFSFMVGGAGYILSKEAVRRFVTKGLPNKKGCKQSHDGFEDVEMGKCMHTVKVIAGNSRDFDTRGRFFQFPPGTQLLEKNKNLDCCSDYTIAFHYIGSRLMYLYDYLIYHQRPYGIVYLPEELPKKLEAGATMPTPTEPPISTTPIPRRENHMVYN